MVFPDPAGRGAVSGFTEAGGKGNPVERKVADSEPLSIFVFKTLSDPFAGRINYFKVVSGVMKNDATVTNFTRGTSERFQHMQVMQALSIQMQVLCHFQSVCVALRRS